MVVEMWIVSWGSMPHLALSLSISGTDAIQLTKVCALLPLHMWQHCCSHPNLFSLGPITSLTNIKLYVPIKLLSNRFRNMLYDCLIFVSNELILKYTLRQNVKRKKPIHYYWTYFLMDKVLRAQKWKKRKVLSWHALSTLVVVTGGDVNNV